MTSKNFASGLRQLADWYEKHPDMLAPETPMLNVFGVANSQEAAQEVARALGTATKDWSESLFYLARDFNGVTLRFVFTRNSVCSRCVVGTRMVPEVPAVPARPAHEEDVIEWDCDSILAELESDADAEATRTP